MMRRFASVGLLLLAGVSPSAMAQDGSDINQAIPIYFEQEVRDIVDSQLKMIQVYSITLAATQRLSVVGTQTGTNPNWCIGLYAPTTTTLANVARTNCSQISPLAWNGFRVASLTFNYQAPTAGKYYILVQTFEPTTAFKLQATATGTAIRVPNPPTAGCLTGRVDSITYSLQLIAAGLADEASIGGQKLCAASSCTVKPPLYPEIVNRLENALKAKVNVEACYDSAGNIFQIKLVQP